MCRTSGASNTFASGDDPARWSVNVDETLKESFPASDPPSRTVMIRIGAPLHHPNEVSAAR
jgi:hypothetical protein